MREWRRKNIERAREGECASKKHRAEVLWSQILDSYGPFCSCCGEIRRRFLTLEHVNQDGKAHRERRTGRYAIYLDVVNEGCPTDKYAILCLNCNWARRFGPCPHELEREGVEQPPFVRLDYKRTVCRTPEGQAAVAEAIRQRSAGVPKPPEQRAKIAESLKQYWRDLPQERRDVITSQTLAVRWNRGVDSAASD